MRLESCTGGSVQFMGPFNLAGVGSFRLVTSETGSDRLGDSRQIRGPRRAQPRKARKGLPVSFMRDGAELRKPVAEG